MKRLAVLSGLIVIISVAAILYSLQPKYLTCQVFYRHDVDVKANSEAIKTEVVISTTDRQKGLSGRTCIQPNQAMLFVFERSGIYPFWMKDMKFPIDIIWLDEQKAVVKVERSVSPETFPRTFTNDKPAKYVLELQATRAKTLGLEEGTQLTF